MPATDKIKHLVLLMMENRSFDHFFGFLKSPSYPINGLNGDESNPDAEGNPVKVSRDARISGDLLPDPGHDFLDVNEQIFGNRGGLQDSTPLMSGFIKNYQSHTGNAQKAKRILKCFDPARIPVITTLAQQYAVCDNWFSSVPGPTLPNRAFVHFGTSMGRLDMSPDYGGTFNTIYEVLDKRGISSKIYFHDSTLAQTVSFLGKNQGRFFFEFNDFLKACKKGALPNYSVVEPLFNSDSEFAANDQHPDHDVAEGDSLIRRVYSAIRKNQQLWESTMLVIVYDEHGGLYDHVAPPSTANPDGKNNTLHNFKFDRLGVRVPAVIVSPYIKQGTIISSKDTKNYFDHTSVIATARKLFTSDFATNALTERDRQADTLDICLNLDTPRTDTVQFAVASNAASNGAGAKSFSFAAAAKPKRVKTKPLTELQRSQIQQALALEATLPPNQHSGKSASSFKTEEDVASFLREVKKKFLAAARKAERTNGDHRPRTRAAKIGRKK
jgi:phospholipase C